MVEVRVEIVPLAPRRPLLGARMRAHLLDEDPVAQPLRAFPLGVGVRELDPVAADVDLHVRPGGRATRRPRPSL